MATGIQTGIRTGSAPLPAGKGPAGGGGGLGKVMAAWSGMSTKIKVLVCVGVGVFVLAAIGGFAYTSANRHVSLYATNLTPGDINEIGRRLNEWNIQYSLEGSKIMIHPGQRQRVVGLLLNYGLPHRPLASTTEGGGMAPKSDAEKKQMALEQLTAVLVDQIRHLEPVAEAYVNLVPAPEDELLSGQKKEAKATIMLQLKAGMKLKKEQIESIQTIVAGSMSGLEVKNVAITDTNARKYTDEQGRVSLTGDIESGSGGTDPSELGLNNEQLQLKRGFENYYKRKITESLDKVIGTSNYSVAVNAEFDFAQYQVKTLQVGEAGGNNQVVTLVKKSGEDYATAPTDTRGTDGKSKQAKAAPAGVPQSSGSDKTKYNKGTSEIKYESGKVEKMASIPSGAVKRKTVTVALNGKQDASTLDAIKKIASSAIGIDENVGDKVDVVAMAFTEKNPVEVAGFPQQGAFPQATSGGSGSGSTNRAWLVAGMLVPTGILLTILAVFLVRQRRVQTDKTGLILTTTPGSTTSDISDLLSDKIGRSTASTQTTRANNTEQLEKLAKEKPTKVAELLKSTWLSDKER